MWRWWWCSGFGGSLRYKVGDDLSSHFVSFVMYISGAKF